MAVKYQPGREVMPVGRIPYADVNARNFGAQIGQAMQGLGQDVKEIDERYQEAEARDADTEYQRELSRLWYDPDKNEGYSLKHQKDALDQNYKDVQAAARQALGKISEKLSGKQAREMFLRSAEVRFTGFSERMSAHASQQRTIWEKTSSDARVKESVTQAVNFYNDDKAFEQALRVIEIESLTQANLDGDGEASPITVQRRRAYEGAAWASRLMRYKQDDPQKAWDLFNSNRHRIDTVTAGQLEATLRGAVVPVWAKNAADAIMKGAPAPNATLFTDKIEYAESRGRRFDENGKLIEGPMTKHGTAKGEMQVLDSTNLDPGFGVKPAANDTPEERARVGRDYGNAMLARYGNQTLALAAYNWGPGNVDALIAKGFDPRNGGEAEQLFMAKLPEETRNYIEGINKKFPQTAGTMPTAADVDKHLASWIAQAREMGKVMFPNDPVEQEMLVSQVQQKVNVIAAGNAATARAHRDTLVNAVLGINANGQQLPPAQRPKTLTDLLKLNGAQDAWVASDADQKRAILGMLEQEASGAERTMTPEAYDAYYALSSLSANDPEKFLNTNLVVEARKSGITNAYLDRLTLIQREMGTRANRDVMKGASQQSALRIAKNMLAAAKIDVTPKEGTTQAKTLAAFEGRLFEALDRFTDTNKKLPSDGDVREIVGALLAQGRQTNETYIFGTPPRAFESEDLTTWQTDQEAPASFVAALRKRLKREPTQAEVVRSYTDYLIFLSAGKKKAK